MPTLSELFVELKLSADSFNNGLKAAQKEAKEFEKNIKPTLEATKQLGIVIQKVYSSPAIEGGVLFSTRGGDFLIIVGDDFVVGYRSHDETAVHLFCVETIAAQLLTPEAVCVIRPS